MSIFKSYDVRGVYPTELNERLAFKMGAAFGTINKGNIVVGRDLRQSSKSLRNQLVKGLLSSGCDVIDIGVVTTPLVNFAVANYGYDGGIMITASHNPTQYNGFKFTTKNAVPIGYDSGIDMIEKLIKNNNFAKGNKGKIIKKNFVEDYVKFLSKKINTNGKRLRIAVEAYNGCASKIHVKALKKIGMKVVKIHCDANGKFPNDDPDPSKNENLVELSKTVKEKKCDMGFAFDGDADRLAVVDDRGNIIKPHHTFILLIREYLKNNKNRKIVYDALASSLIGEEIKNNKGIPIICKVGHTHISRKLSEVQAILAGEVSGHYFFNETFNADDVLLAAFKIIEFVIDNGLLSLIVDSLPSYPSGSTRVDIPPGEKFNFVSSLEENFKKKYKVDTLDGVRITIKSGWVLFRPSNTEEKISIAYEAKNEKDFKEIETFVYDVIRRIPK